MSCVLVSSAVIGAEPFSGLAVGHLLKVYAELGWGDVRDDFKKLGLKLKHPLTIAATTTSTSAPAASTSTAEVGVAAKRLNTVAAAERAELLMSAIHQDNDNDNENDNDSLDDPSGGKLGGGEDRGFSDDFRASPTKPHLQTLQLGSGHRELVLCAEAEEDGDDDDRSPLALSPTGSASDPLASPPADPASSTEPFASDFSLELSTTAEVEAAPRASTSAAAATDAASSPAVSGHRLQSHMRLDS